MNSLSYRKGVINRNVITEVWLAVESLKGAFISRWGKSADEAMRVTGDYVLAHYDVKKGNLKSYVYNLIDKVYKPKKYELASDILEDTYEDVNGCVETLISDRGDIVSLDREIIKLALTFMGEFLKSTEALENQVSNTLDFSTEFKVTVNKIFNRCKKAQCSYLSLCQSLLKYYKESFIKFLHEDEDTDWEELNIATIKDSRGKRSVMKAVSGVLTDADREEWFCVPLTRGNLVGIDYTGVYNTLCAYLDSNKQGYSPIKFTIKEDTVCRSLGGSISILNPNKNNIKDIYKDEILTNLIVKLKVGTALKFVHMGSRHMYFLIDDLKVMERLDTLGSVRGVPLNFSYKVFATKQSD